MATNFNWGFNLINQLKDAFDVIIGHNHDGVNSRAISTDTASNTLIFDYDIEELSAGVDISPRNILEIPIGYKITLTSAKIIANGTAVGIDNSNTSVFSLFNGTDEIVSKTFDGTNIYPVDNASVSLGTLSSTYKIIESTDKLNISITNGTTASTPKTRLILSCNIEKV